MTGAERFAEYSELWDLPEGAIVQDAAGQVWQLRWYRPTRGSDEGREIWLCPFSDEYAFMIKSTHDPDTQSRFYALGVTPMLPITRVTLPLDREART